jgi:phage gpG-like protein
MGRREVISGYLIGDKALVARLSALPETIRPKLDETVMRLGRMLQGTVKHDWLRGPRPSRLGIVTGRLANSIAVRFESTATAITATVGTNVPYGVMWETTGKPAQTIRPKRAKALRFEIGGEVLFRKSVTIPAQPPRPFLKPALQQLRPRIITEIEVALTQAAKTALAA